jgi:hypothetical protein
MKVDYTATPFEVIDGQASMLVTKTGPERDPCRDAGHNLL